MSPGILNFFRRITPEYQEAYTQGFEAGKRLAREEILDALSKIRKSTAYVESTSTYHPQP